MDPMINPLECYLISKNILKKEKLLTGTVARIYFANSNKWENKKCGFLLIIKSKITKGIMMKLVSFNFETLYEIEILQNSKFQKESSFFYSLSFNEIQIGICFAEGSSFDKFIQITEKHSSSTKFSLNANLKEFIPKTKDFLSPRKRDPQTPRDSLFSPRKNSNPPKLIISEPKNVQHSIHVGADSDRNFIVLELFNSHFSLMNCQRIGKSSLKKLEFMRKN
jgi:hypothetical protein